MWLFAAIIGWPLVEIALFVVVGGWIGLWATLGVVVGTGLLGISILRGRGMRSVADLHGAVTGVPHQAVGQGLMTMLAAILLVLPGFLTDVLGFLLLIPVVQRAVLHQIGVEIRAAGVNLFASGLASRAKKSVAPEPEVIEGEFQELDAAKRPTHPPSGWTRH